MNKLDIDFGDLNERWQKWAFRDVVGEFLSDVARDASFEASLREKAARGAYYAIVEKQRWDTLATSEILRRRRATCRVCGINKVGLNNATLITNPPVTCDVCKLGARRASDNPCQLDKRSQLP